MLVKEAISHTGGLSDPEKMPGYSYNLPATECPVGSRLREVGGSICSSCYAHEGRYRFDNVKQAMHRRLDRMKNDPEWVSSMVFLIEKWSANIGVSFFRWHDSGDIMDEDHLHKIVDVCEQTPFIHHWLPTREIRTVRKYMKTHDIPANLCIRLSANYVDQSTIMLFEGCTFSSSSTTDEVYPEAYPCPVSRSQSNSSCGSCRACWDKKVSHVDYRLH